MNKITKTRSEKDAGGGQYIKAKSVGIGCERIVKTECAGVGYGHGSFCSGAAIPNTKMPVFESHMLLQL
jgi:hypothetical protein